MTVKNFIKQEVFAGLLLIVLALFAIVWSNSPWSASYQSLFGSHQVLDFQLSHSLQHWINHGLMAIFFLVVGLEIKRELLVGELNTIPKATLPGFAALGGMIVPATIFMFINHAHPEAWSAWAVPVATDIAFSLAVLQLLGWRAPITLKLFLMALATFDDLGAVVIIAVFYTQQVNLIMLGLVALCLVLLIILNYLEVAFISLYLLLGVILWTLMLYSGVDAAITGVLVALTIPLQARGKNLLQMLEEDLHGMVVYFVLPLFALANAGVSLANMHWHDIFNHLPLGILLGLLLGKPLGIISFSYLAVKCKLAKLPNHMRFPHLIGVAIICGIGFTMSLLLGDLAFNHQDALIANQIKLGIILASVFSGIIGYIWLRFIIRFWHDR